MSIENLQSVDPFAEADADNGKPVSRTANGDAVADAAKADQSVEKDEPKSDSKKAANKVKRDVAQPTIENLKIVDPFAEADEDNGESKKAQTYIHIRIQQRNGRKTLTTIQGLPVKFDPKKILRVIKKKFACNGTVIDTGNTDLGEVIQLQGDKRLMAKEFLVSKEEGLGLDEKTIKVHGF